MPRGTYTVVFQAVAVTAAQDFFELNAPSTAAVEIISVTIGQSSDAGDAQDEMLRVRIRSGMTSSGSGGSAPTPVKTAPLDAAAAATAEVNNTTASSGGTIIEHVDECFNVRGGWVYMPPPEARIIVAPSGRLAVNLPTAPADSLTMSGTLTFRELS